MEEPNLHESNAGFVGIALLGERPDDIGKVTGPIPVISTIYPTRSLSISSGSRPALVIPTLSGLEPLSIGSCLRPPQLRGRLAG